MMDAKNHQKSTAPTKIEPSAPSALESCSALTSEDIGPSSSPALPQVIFFGNGMLADFALAALRGKVEVIFHAHRAEDLPKVAELKKSHPDAYGILASFGILIKPDLLDLFAPEGILNLHPSLLPQYRGASPIESAILAGDHDFGYSIMRLARKMDAGPIYHQATLKDLPLDKAMIYQALAESGINWLIAHLPEIRSLQPQPQDDAKATFTTKLTKAMSELQPSQHSAEEIYCQIVAFQEFPKPKYEFFGKKCIILKAHPVDATEIVCDPSIIGSLTSPLMIKCADRNFVAVEMLQPEGKKPMDAKSFMNGYGKSRQA